MKLQKKQENLYNRNTTSGITLIALVVTIVVLLILAGITISTLFGENGVISAARRAEEATKQDENTTNEGLQNLEDKMNNQLGIDTSSLTKLISTNSFVTAEQGNQIVTDKTGKSMIVPVGFRVINDATEIDKGVVIEDKIGNQYVWVPVSDSQFSDMFGTNDNGANYFGKLYDFTTEGKSNDPINVAIGSISGYREPDIITQYDGSDATSNASYFKTAMGDMTGSAFQKELQDKFNEMVKSVKEYKGFYIGRYEVSNLDAANPKTIKGVYPSVTIDWYNMYKNMQGIEDNASIDENVKINMIWGCQFDRTLDWIANTDTKIGYAGVKNSTTWGNYKDSDNFEYIKIDNTKGTKVKDTGTLIPTGSTERNKANNIYDLAGNAYEWTMEALSTSSRVKRGGNCDCSGSSSAASNREGNFSYLIYGGNYLGSRLTLYVKATTE